MTKGDDDQKDIAKQFSSIKWRGDDLREVANHLRWQARQERIQQPEPEPAPQVKRRGGRPRLACNVWALEQIAMGKEPREIYPEWLKRHPEGDELREPEKSFQKAIARGKQSGNNS